MASIAASLDQIKHNPLAFINRKMVEQACAEHGYTWRDRELNPAITISLFLQQIVRGNIPLTEVRHVAQSLPQLECGPFTAQAYNEARARIPLEVYQTIFQKVCDAAAGPLSETSHRWHGHRTFSIDGSTFSMPDTPELRKAFGTPSGPKPGCAFPVAHLLVLFSASTGLLIDWWASHFNTGDLSETREAHMHLDNGDILLGDDTFSGYAHMALAVKNKLHCVFPAHHLRTVDFKKGRPHCGEGKNRVAGMPTSRWIKSLGKEDQLVEYFKPKTRVKWMTQSEWDALPASIIVREIRRPVRRPGLGKITVTLVTTLLDPKKYPSMEVVELRLTRWSVETNLAHLKTTMGMDVLRCKSEAAVRKERVMFGIVYNLVRLVMLQAAEQQDVPVSRVSFIDAYKWMRHAKPGDELPSLVINPSRPTRIEPRCKKRRPKQYDLMNKPREELRKILKNKAKAA
jgi:hypothetical protein